MAKITIENFQSIKNLTLNIEGFTVIVGRNNIGKSALIRAVESALTNQTGNKFIRKDEKKARVVIDMDTIGIDWVKSHSSTTYHLRGYKEPFSKLNGTVPKPIIDAGFGKMNIGDQKVLPLIANQFEPLFLINKPGSTITEVLASLYQIDTLSKADDLCQKEIKSQKSLLKTRESDLEKVTQKLTNFVDFDDIKKTIEKLVKKDLELQNLREEIKNIVIYEQKIQNLTKSLKKLKKIKDIIVPNKDNCDSLSSEVTWLQTKEKAYLTSLSLTYKLKNIIKIDIPEIFEIETSFEESLQIKKWEHTYNTLINLIQKKEKTIQLIDITDIAYKAELISVNLNDFIPIKTIEDTFLKTVKTSRSIRDEVKKTIQKLEEEQKKIKDIKICPLCEKPL